MLADNGCAASDPPQFPSNVCVRFCVCGRIGSRLFKVVPIPPCFPNDVCVCICLWGDQEKAVEMTLIPPSSPMFVFVFVLGGQEIVVEMTLIPPCFPNIFGIFLVCRDQIQAVENGPEPSKFPQRCELRLNESPELYSHRYSDML